MAEYIEREALLQQMHANFQQASWYGCEEPVYPIVEETILEAHEEDVAPVVHGRWIGEEINIETDDIPSNYRQRGQRVKDIVGFIESGASAAEVFSDSAKNGLSLYSSTLSAIRRNGFPVSVIRRGERVFLIKEAYDGLDTP